MGSESRKRTSEIPHYRIKLSQITHIAEKGGLSDLKHF